MSKRRSIRLVEKEVEESPEIETKNTKDVAEPVEEPVMEEEVEDEEEAPLIRRNSRKPATTKSTTTKTTTPKSTTKFTTTKADPTPKPIEESKPEESEKLEESEPETESEPVGDSEPENQEMEEEEVEKEDVLVEPQRKEMQAKKVAAKKPPSKAVKSIEKEVSKPITTKQLVKTTKPKIPTPKITPKPVEKLKKKEGAEVEGKLLRRSVKGVASKGARVKTVARKGAESSKGKEIAQEPESDRQPPCYDVGSHDLLCEKAKHAMPYGGWLTLVFKHWNIRMVGDYGTMSHLTNQIIGQKDMSYTDGVLKMNGEAKGDAVGARTSTESIQATYALVKQLSDQNQMMQNMLNSVTQLCTVLHESNRRVEVRLDKAGIQGREDSEAKEESSNAASDEDDDELEDEVEESEKEEVVKNDEPQVQVGDKTPLPSPPPTKTYVPPVPYPQRLVERKLSDKFTKFLNVMKSLQINIPFLEAMSQMPAYAKFLKEILSNKRKLEDELITLPYQESALVQRTMPKKQRDPRSFTLSAKIGDLEPKGALTDLGASVNLMPLSIDKHHKFPLHPTRKTI
ncbi:uncharacterized protein LOC130591084 [Beta vulgaris subsp. vulgaris]|uniref:uncharacterized protein LOC130591084 n=1 Tax=Beta vulgaris subsp. vulgaris TaxID=3555 RepID=UPI002546B934|nr:uncharacterized protein LOC130591084 [Beta vulgaris subsp. vulgaris]